MNKSAKPYFQCPGCEEVFYYYKSLREHMKQVHPSAAIPQKSKLQVFWMTKDEVNGVRKSVQKACERGAKISVQKTDLQIPGMFVRQPYDDSHVPDPAYIVCEYCEQLMLFQEWPEHYIKYHEER